MGTTASARGMWDALEGARTAGAPPPAPAGRTPAQVPDKACITALPVPSPIVVSNFQPIGPVGPLDPVSFDVDMGNRAVAPSIDVTYNSDEWCEVAFDGYTTRGKYRVAASQVTMISAGHYHVVLYRAGGWPDSPSVNVYARTP